MSRKSQKPEYPKRTNGEEFRRGAASYDRMRATICIKPKNRVVVPDNETCGGMCCVEFDRGERILKFINRACPRHGSVECIPEIAG